MSKQFPGGLITKTPVTPAGPYQTGAAPGIWTLAEQAYWNKQGLWPTAGLNPTDPYFPYVTALFHGDGTNGAQNNTFLDSSTNNFTITRNGNTTQGTFTPYGSNWSNYFNGSSSFLTMTGSAATNFSGVDWTVETWVYSNDAPPADYTYIIQSQTGANNWLPYLGLGLMVNGRINCALNAANYTSTQTINFNAWNHLAMVRSGGVVKLYINGVASSVSATVDINNSNLSFWFGKVDNTPGGGGYIYYLNGYLSNIRFVKGTAVYTSNFTVPTAPLTAITNTSLLTCQSNRFIDNSTNAFTITSTNATVQRFSPFSPTTAYSTSVIGGSGYFDGSDELTFTTNSSLEFGTGNFTIEFWVYGALNNDKAFLETRPATSGSMHITTGGYGGTTPGCLRFVTSAGTLTSGSVLITNGAWNHCAIVRSSGTVTLYVNGVSTTSGSVTTNFTGTGTWYIGSLNGAVYLNANLADFRIVKGTAVYTSNFTPPTAPLTAITNTSLLLSYTNAGILDNAMISDQETVGNAQISTSVYKYGTGSMSFDGTDDRLVSVANPGFAFGTGNFTVECWINPNNVSGASQLGFLQTSTSAGGLQTAYTTGIIIAVGMNAAGGALTGGLLTNVAGTNVGSNSAVLATGTWYHIAVVRNSGAVTVYVNGNVHATGTAAGNCTGQNLCIGGYYSTSYLYNGYIDDLRITKGIARYTTTFTPPTSAFPDQ